MKKTLLFIVLLQQILCPSSYTYDPRIQTHWIVTYYSSSMLSSKNVFTIGPIISPCVVVEILRNGNILGRIASIQCVKRAHSETFSKYDMRRFLHNPICGKIALCKEAKNLISENKVPFGFWSILRNYPLILSMLTSYQAEDVKQYNLILKILQEDFIESNCSDLDSINEHTINFTLTVHRHNFSSKKYALKTIDEILESWPRKAQSILESS